MIVVGEMREVDPAVSGLCEVGHDSMTYAGTIRRSQEYFIDVQQNLETLNHDLSVASWDLTIP